MKNRQPSVRTGLLLPALLGALTPARALTSYLRRRYVERYVPRYVRSLPLFVFDMIVAGIAVVLILGDLYLALMPLPQANRLALSLRAPEVKTLAPIALEATVSARGSRTEEDLTLRWVLPPGAEILSAHPALNEAGEMNIESLGPGESQTAKVVVRLRSRVGEKVRIGFFLRDSKGWMRGTDERDVKGSGVVFGMTSAFQEQMPLSPWQVGWLRNTTDLPIEHLAVAGERDITLAPRATKLFEYTESHLVNDERTGGMKLILSADGKPVQDVSGWRLFDSNDSGDPLTLLPWVPGEPLRVHVAEALLEQEAERKQEMDKREVQEKASGGVYQSYSPAELVLVHPGLSEGQLAHAVQTIPLTSDHVSLPTPRVFDATSWYAWVIRGCIEGSCATSGLVRGRVTTAFTPDATVHYYLSSGDQVGIGPFPPRVGEATRVWVEWSLAPITKALDFIRFETVLPPNVRYTGRTSLPDGGVLIQEDEALVWNLGSHGPSTVPLRARFEIEVTPKDALGVMYQNPVRASARDTEADLLLTSSTQAITQ